VEKAEMIQKIKICYILGTLDVGGTEKQLLLLCKHINRDKFSPFIISLRGGRMREEFRKEDIPTMVAGKRFRFDIIALFRLMLILLRNKPDILHTFMFTSNTWGRLAGILAGIPVIIASERSTDLWKKNYHFFLDRILGFFTDKIVCNSTSVRNRYEKKLAAFSKKFVVIKNGIEMERFDVSKITRKEEKEKIIFTASRLSPEKGIEFLIEAARIILGKIADVKFLIAGEGPLKDKLEKLADNYGIKDSVFFLGYQENIQDFIGISDMVVLPSLWEGMPNFVLEAMAMKKPVVATDTDGTRELITDCETGFLVPPGKSSELAEKIMMLLCDEELASKTAEKAYMFVRENFDVSMMVSSYESLYQDLMRRRG